MTVPNTTPAWPVEIRLAKDRHALHVTYDDGKTFSLSAELLRVTSPSAEVQGHSEAQRKTVGGKRNVTTLQFWTVIHAVIAMLFIAAMLAHIYIGTIGMEGAFEAMGTGEVDINWAKEHHSLWVEEEQAKGHAPSGSPTRAVPAE